MYKITNNTKLISYLKEKYKNRSFYSNNCVYTQDINNQEIIDIFNKHQNLFRNIFDVIKCILYFNAELQECKTCGKLIFFNNHNTHCSRSCAQVDPEIINRHEQTRKNNYEINKISYKKAAQKVKETNLKKYGVACVFQLDSVKEKSKNTCKQRYGVEYNLQRKEVKEAIKLKYGVDNVAVLPEIKEKIKNSTFLKYNVPSYAQTDEWKKRVEKTSIEKYGFKRHQMKDGWERILSWNQIVIPLFSKEEYKGYKTEYKWKCVKCGNTFVSSLHSSKSMKKFLGYQYMPRCPKCYPPMTTSSFVEKELSDFCKQYFPDLKENNRKLIKPLEVDILIEDIKLAIEFDGCYYHSIEAGTPSNYHLTKTEMVEAKGYRLIHIFENEWIENKELIKEKLKNVFENKEQIDFSKDLDRSWYQLKEIPGYKLIIKPPTIFTWNNLHIENCGYLNYIKEN